jgi:hypothetical protein
MSLTLRHPFCGCVTPMRHKSRLDRIDRRIDRPLRAGDACRCAKPVYVVRHADEPDPGPQSCATCGGERPVILVSHVSLQLWEAI